MIHKFHFDCPKRNVRRVAIGGGYCDTHRPPPVPSIQPACTLSAPSQSAQTNERWGGSLALTDAARRRRPASPSLDPHRVRADPMPTAVDEAKILAREEEGRRRAALINGKKKLKATLSEHLSTIGSLFQMWDLNGNGVVRAWSGPWPRISHPLIVQP